MLAEVLVKAILLRTKDYIYLQNQRLNVKVSKSQIKKSIKPTDCELSRLHDDNNS